MSECQTDFDFDAMRHWALHEPEKFGEFRNVLIKNAINRFFDTASGCDLQSRIDAWCPDPSSKQGHFEYLSMQLGEVVGELANAVAMIEELVNGAQITLDRTPD